MWQDGWGLIHAKLGDVRSADGVHFPLKRLGESVRIFLFAMLALPLGIGCSGGEKAGRSEGSEAGDCSDDADNDLDGFFDCDDDGCEGSDACDEAEADADADSDVDSDDTGSPIEPIVDNDDDGVVEADDCDDDDASIGSVVDDADCDGVLTGDDCDDGDSDSTVVSEDGDCDGVLTGDDCDDGDPDSTVVSEDGDCDGVLTGDDCDDGDSDSTVVSEDGDCDGVLTGDDCDDTDPDATTVATDEDCDGREDYVADHGGRMIKIDAQTFEMGCTAGMADCEEHESPAHFVTLTNDFFIGETEVTQGEYEAMMGTNPSNFSSCGLDCPVEDLSWHEAAAFANAVSDSEGLEQCYTCTEDGSIFGLDCPVAIGPYSCDGYRAPTEAEWEAAARCGADTLYAGSTVIGHVAWWEGNSGGTTQPVATKISNDCGLYDMTGNVWEWTQDFYSASYYSTSPDIDPVGATSSTDRTTRGGSWYNSLEYLPVSRRYGNLPWWSNFQTGFRLARTSP
jgi:formylglycine-generating enzyme required for sulfatase activity